MPKCWTCDEIIHFDPDRRSVSGKQIPLGEDDEPHQCPNKPPYVAGESRSNKGVDSINMMGIGYSIEKMEKSISKMEDNLLKLVLAVQSIQMRLEGQKTLDGA